MDAYPIKQMDRLTRSVMSLVTSVLLLASTAVVAESTKYITDVFEVTMRSGTSTANSIVRVLRSGQSVTVLEQDLVSQYSLVETEDKTKGYVLSRYLDDIPSARSRLDLLQKKSEKQKQSIETLGEEIDRIKSDLEIERSDTEVLKSTLLASETELDKVRTASENTLNILEENDRLNTIVSTLREEKQLLSDENDSLKDSTQMDWFIRGAAVSLVAFIFGIIVTRIRWRKQDSWGSY